MCRIFGYFQARPTIHEFDTVAARLHHTHPGGAGVAPPAGSAMDGRRMAIVDLDGGSRAESLDPRVTVVFTGELYNVEEIRHALRLRGHARVADRALVPALYEAYGERFAEHLDGEYAVAILDRRGTPTLLLATDDNGHKPLYYRWDPAVRSLYFASGIPPLLCSEGVTALPWADGLEAYLAGRTPLGEQTMFDQIKVLPPAATLVYRWGEPYRIIRRAEPPVEPIEDLATAADLLRRQLSDEVERLVGGGPVAVAASGGLDSSLVATLAARHGPVHTFHVAYRGTWPSDESHFALQAARRAGTVHHVVELDPLTFPAAIEDTVWPLGSPNADPITLSTYELFGAVRDAGLGVVLTGDGADEFFGGHPRMRRAVRAAATGADWCAEYLDAVAVVPAARRHRLYTAEYADHVRTVPPLPPEALDTLRGGPGSVLRRIMEFEQRYRLPAYHLRRVEHLSVASAVQARLPYGRRAVRRIGVRLADPLHVRAHQGKVALKAAARGLLPQAIVDRPKQPFTLPLGAMLVPGRPLWDYARDMLAGARLAANGRLDPPAIDELFTVQERRADETTALTIWALLVHEVWLEHFQAGRHRTSGPVAVTA